MSVKKGKNTIVKNSPSLNNFESTQYEDCQRDYHLNVKKLSVDRSFVNSSNSLVDGDVEFSSVMRKWKE